MRKLKEEEQRLLNEKLKAETRMNASKEGTSKQGTRGTEIAGRKAQIGNP